MSTRSILVAAAVTDGFTGLVPRVRDAVILELLKLLSGTSMTKAQLIAAAQADGFTGVEPTVRDALILELLQQVVAGGGGGGGVIAASGDNYCFSGVAPAQIFKLKNINTGLANRIDAAGIDGEQDVATDVGSAC